MFFNLKKIRFLIVNIPVFVFLILTQTSVAKRGSKGREVEKPKLTLTIAYDTDDIFQLSASLLHSPLPTIVSQTNNAYGESNHKPIYSHQPDCLKAFYNM